jgi:two-component system LytT family sensor kinase
MVHPLAQKIYDNREYQFWVCQAVGWSGYGIGTFLTITLVDGNVSWPHIGHITLSSVLGVLISWPLRYLYRWAFIKPFAQRVVVASFAIIVLSGVWTASRIQVYAWMVNEPAIWTEVHYWYFGSLSIFLSWTVLYYGIKYYQLLSREHQMLLEESEKKRAEQLRRSEAESAAREAQLKMLRYQLNPHFLFNALNAINALVRLEELGKAQGMIQLLSNFLRHSLDQDYVENVTLEEEIATLKLYLDIEKTRFEDRLILEYEIEPDALTAMVPGLILQPIIENSIKYAISESEQGGTIRIAASVQGDCLLLEISDTGPGLNGKSSLEGRGVGLRNTIKRLETLYDSKYSFDTSDRKPSGLTVTICLPLESSEVLSSESEQSGEMAVAEA